MLTTILRELHGALTAAVNWPSVLLAFECGVVAWHRWRVGARGLRTWRYLLFFSSLLLLSCPYRVALALQLPCPAALRVPFATTCDGGRTLAATTLCLKLAAAAAVAASSAETADAFRPSARTPLAYLIGVVPLMLLILVLQGDPDSLSDNLVPAVQAAARLPNGAVMLAAYVASLTITEELFWRGFLQTLLLQMVARNRARQALVLGIIALAWTGAHTIVEGYGVQASAAVFIIGIALGVFAQRFGVAVTTATHVLFNLLVLWANTRH